MILHDSGCFWRYKTVESMGGGVSGGGKRSHQQTGSTIMRIRDYSIGKHRQRREVWKKRAMEALRLPLSPNLCLFAVEKAEREHEQVRKLLQRRRHVRTSSFNTNFYSEQQCLRDFRFRSENVGMISDMLDFTE